MTRELFGLRLSCPTDLADGLCQALIAAGCGGVEQRDQPTHSELIIYAESSSACQVLQQRLGAVLDGLDLDPARRPRLEALPPESSDWETAWIRYLAPVVLSNDIVLAPGDTTPQLLPGQRCLRLEAELAFGFGDHPTTRLAARELIDQCAARHEPRVLDVGTGTGVLTLIAALSGVKDATGIDIDPRSVASAQRNALANGLEDVAHFSLRPIEELSDEFEIVVANIELGPLLSLAGTLAARVAPGGSLLLTGILEDQANELESALVTAGLEVTDRRSADDWKLLVLRKPG